MPQDKIIEQLELNTDKAIEMLNGKVTAAQEEILSELNDFIYQLKYNADGTLNASVENLKIIDKYRVELNKLVDNSGLSDAVQGFQDIYKDNSKIIDQYFSSIVGEYKNNEALFNAILESNNQTVVDSLLGSGIDANFKQPLLDALKQSVTSGSNKAELKQVLDSFLKNNPDVPSTLSRYTSQIASDATTQFNSQLIDTIGSGLDLEYFYYKGTIIKDTRPFCIHCANEKYFTADELKKYVLQQSQLRGGKGWQGMIPGTNWSNFKIRRGGYNCRHYVIPVSKSLYEKATNKMAA